MSRAKPLFSFTANLPDGSRREACIESIVVEADVALPESTDVGALHWFRQQKKGPPGKQVTATGYITLIVTPGEQPAHTPAPIFDEIEVTDSKLEHVINRFLYAVATAEPSR